MANALQSIINEVIEQESKVVKWPEKFQNKRTNKFFKPQNEEIRKFVFEEHAPRYVYLMAAEGSGKTATASVKALNNLRKGLSGSIVCTDLPMMKKVWDEIKQWIPKSVIVPEHQHMLNPTWSPYKGFEIVFHAETGGYSTAIIGGLGDPSTYSKWEALNINWLYGDEFRSVPSDDAMKVLSGRIRLLGPNGEPPQMFIASTPTTKDHWMYEWFGPIEGDDDPRRLFKEKSRIIRLNLEDNLYNLTEDHIEQRGLTLSENEKTIFIEGGWGESENELDFLDSIELWDRLYDPELKPIRKKTDPNKDWSDQLVIGMDGSIKKDSFAIVGVTRHPKRRSDVAVRLTKEFQPKGGKIDFTEVKEYLLWVTDEYNVITVVFDIYQLYQLTEELRKEGVTWFQEFNQQSKRLLCDSMLYDNIMLSKIAHMNQPELRSHINNAGVKYDPADRKKRLVKKTYSKKIDLAVSLAMASFEALRLNL